mgnify:CR=1 FL=1
MSVDFVVATNDQHGKKPLPAGNQAMNMILQALRNP